MRWSVILVLASLIAAPVLAQVGGEIPQVPVSVYASHDGIAPGGRIRIAVVYELPAYHHIQQNEFLYAEPASGEPFQIDRQELPASVIYDEEPVFTGKVVVRYDLSLAREVPLGPRTLKIKVGYQFCSERPIYACYPPEEREVALDVRVVASGTPVRPINPAYFGSARPPEQGKTPPGIRPMGSGATPETERGPAGQTQAQEAGEAEGGAWLAQAPASEEGEAASGPPSSGAQVSGPAPSGSEPSGGASEGAGLGVQEGLAAKLRGALARGSWLAFAIVLLAGFLTSFTPCVYPMIPITIGYLMRGSHSRFGGFLLSVFLVLGIAIVYSVLGLVAALSGGVFGAALQSTTATVFIAAVFVAMGASMLGAFDISLPSGLQTKMQTGQRSGWAGAVLMGGVTGLVASPCVGPVLVVLLTWVAQVGRPVYGFTLLFTFALGLGILFLVLGTFVGALRTLPKAGQWMESVKHDFGWIFLALAVFYLRTWIGPTATTIAYGVLLVLCATQFGAFTTLPMDAPKGARWRKGIAVVLAVWGIALLGRGLLPGHIGPGAGARTEAARSSAVQWRTDEARALAEARETGRPVLIDFTAAWCAACHELDQKTWVHPDVAEELSRYVTLRLDMTHRNDETIALGNRWKVSGLPTVVVLDPAGNEVERFFGFRPADQVLPLLRRVG